MSLRVQIAPSILSADFARLGDQVAQAEKAGVDRIHIDVMDGHFVPNLAMGPSAVSALRKITRLPLEVHMMILHPDSFIDNFVDAGADLLLVHWEANNDLSRTIGHIKARNRQAGVALNPATPAAMLEEVLGELDQVLVMTVNPGFAHQPFLPNTLPKVTHVRKMIDRLDRPCRLEVDGGITPETAPAAVAAGADMLVAGSAIFNAQESIAVAIARLRAAIEPDRDGDECHAARDDRIGTDGREYGAAPSRRRS